MWLIHLKKRLQLLWRFVKLIPQAKDLEEECRLIQQKRNDIQFASDISPTKKEVDVAYQQGLHDGIMRCIKRFWILLFLALPVQAEQTKTILNPFTGRFDFINVISTNVFVAGSNISIVCTSGVCTIGSTGSSGLTYLANTSSDTISSADLEFQTASMGPIFRDSANCAWRTTINTGGSLVNTLLFCPIIPVQRCIVGEPVGLLAAIVCSQ